MADAGTVASYSARAARAQLGPAQLCYLLSMIRTATCILMRRLGLTQIWDLPDIQLNPFLSRCSVLQRTCLCA